MGKRDPLKSSGHLEGVRPAGLAGSYQWTGPTGINRIEQANGYGEGLVEGGVPHRDRGRASPSGADKKTVPEMTFGIDCGRRVVDGELEGALIGGDR